MLAIALVLDNQPTHINYLNKEVAEILENDRRQFEHWVYLTLRGTRYKEFEFTKFLK